jgi:hypothetical protein
MVSGRSLHLPIGISLAVLLLLIAPARLWAQTGLAATLEVLAPGVEVLRSGTSNWIAIEVESIVGAGDTVRTDDTGRALITYFADGTDTEVRPNSEMRIDTFLGSGDTFTLTLEVFVGQTIQRIGRALGDGSSYAVNTPAMTLAARGTQFIVRVESTGRAAMLVREGIVQAEADSEVVEVEPEFGVRADARTGLSEAVRASTFEQLDAALDGCAVTITNPDDVSFNVRSSPQPNGELIATLTVPNIPRVFGITESTGWYRVALDDGFGWIRATALTVERDCAGLRVFPDDTAPVEASSG